MKKTLIALAAIAAVGAASAQVTVYGKLDVGVSNTSAGGTVVGVNQWENSHHQQHQHGRRYKQAGKLFLRLMGLRRGRCCSQKNTTGSINKLSEKQTAPSKRRCLKTHTKPKLYLG